MGRYDDIAALLAQPIPQAVPRTMSAPVMPEEDPNLFWKALDYLNRPYSMVMGGLTGIPSGESFERMGKAITGEQEYGFYDVLTGLGADPEGGLAKWGGLGLDLTLGMFADPLTPLSFGLNKAGSVARAGGKALDAAEFAKRAGGMTSRAIEGGTKLPGQVLKSGVTGLDRVRAAQQGLWSPLNYAGFSLLPPSASAAVARGVDPLAHLISQNPVSQHIRGLVGGYRPMYPDLHEAAKGFKADSREAAEALTPMLKEIVGEVPDSQQRALMTLAIENPALFDKVVSGEDVAVRTGRTATDEEIKQFQQQRKAAVQARFDANRAYGHVLKNELDALEANIDAWQNTGNLQLQSVNDIAMSLGYNTTDDLLEEILSGHRPADILAMESGGVVRGIVPADIVHANVQNKQGKVIRTQRTPGEVMSLYRLRKKGAQTEFGAEFAHELTRGGDAYAIVETASDLAPDIADIGGRGIKLEQRKATVKRIIQGIRDYLEKGNDPWDTEGLKKFLRSSPYNIKAKASVDMLLDAVRARIELSIGRGVYSRLDAESIDWMRHLDEYSRWKAEEAALVAGDELDTAVYIGQRFLETQGYLKRELADIDTKIHQLANGHTIPLPTDPDWSVLLTGSQEGTKLADERAFRQALDTRLDWLARMQDVLQERLDNARNSLPLQEEALIRRQLNAITEEAGNAVMGRWTIADATKTNALFHGYNRYYEKQIEGLVKRRDELKQVLDNPDVFHQSAAVLADLEAQGVLKHKPLEKTVTIRGVQVAVTPGFETAMERAREIHRQIQQLYAETGIPLKNMPYGEGYMKHFFPRKAAAVFGSARNTLQMSIEEMRQKLVASYIDDAVKAGQTPNMDFIKESVEKDLRQMLAGDIVMAGAQAGKGDLDAFKGRKYDVPAFVFNKADLGVAFEEDAAIILNEMLRDAAEFNYGFKVHKFAVDHYGKRLDQIQDASGRIQPGWVPVDFNMPFRDGPVPYKSPFDGMYVPEDVAKQIGTYLKGVNAFVSDKYVAATLDALNKFRGWLSATTLAPFPAYHARNLVSDMLLNHLGGLTINPITPEGRRGLQSYAASADLVLRQGSGSMQGFMQEMQQAFAQRGLPQDLTLDALRRALKREGVLDSVARDIEEIAEEVLSELGIRTPGGSRVGDFFRAANPLSKRGALVRGGYKFGRKVQDFTHAALWIDRMKWHGANTQLTWVEAAKESAQWVKRHLYDYADLTPFEKHVMRGAVPFYCVPESHEILTQQGWKHFADLEKGEMVLAYDVDSGKLQWEPLMDVATFDFDGELMKFDRRGAHFLFTEDHRWPVENAKTFVKGRWYGGERKIVRSYEFNTSHKIPLTGEYEQAESILSPRHAAILGWVVTDGYFRWRGNHCEMLVYQHPKKHLEEIEQLLGNQRRKPHPDSGVCPVGVKRGDVEVITEFFKSKQDLPGIVGRLSREAADAMYLAMMKAEGCKSAAGQEFFAQDPTYNKDVLDAFQMLALMTGRSANINGRGAYVGRNKYIYPLRGTGVKREHYKGVIWCPKTPSGTWVMRHQGGTIITGNTFTAKNVPHILSEYATNPGKFQYLIRAYNGTWAQNPELEPEMISEWLRDNLGAPVAKTKGENGEVIYEIFSPIGWIPMADIAELAGVLRGDFSKTLLSKLTPVIREPLEQWLNMDFFRQEQIDRGQTEDMFGLATRDFPLLGHPRVQHVLNNLRLIQEFDRLDPLGAWTALGRKLGYYTDQRPNRTTVSEDKRWTRFLTGMSYYGRDPERELRFDLAQLERDIETARWKARKSMARGNISESEKYRQDALAAAQERRRTAALYQKALAYRLGHDQ